MAQMVPNVGIDVSKERLDVAVLPAGPQFNVSNDTAGWRELCRRLKPLEVRAIGIEPSGGYERGVIGALLEAGLSVRSVNAWKLRQFAKAAGLLAKNDRLDAQVIALFVATLPCREVRRDPMREHLAELVGARRQMVDLRQVLENHLEQMSDRGLGQMRQRQIRQLNADIVRLDRRIAEAVAAVPAFAARYNLLCSMRGVGPVLAATLLAWLPELGSITRRQVGALVGIVPYDFDSGKMKGLRCIFGGRANVRHVLFMAAQAGTIHNPVLHAFKQHLLAKGKEAKVAVVAIMRKLLTILNAMVRDGQPWRAVEA